MIEYVSKLNYASPALRHIDYRLSFENYRGIHTSQHNRFTSYDVQQILRILDSYAPNESLLRIRTTDTSKRPYNTPEEIDYAEFCHQVKDKTGKGTQDAMRKNFFVDWHRMRFINRYDANKSLVKPYEVKQIKYVSLSNFGLKFINTDNMLELQYLYSKALNNLLGGLVQSSMDLLELESVNHITFAEFMYFVTSIGADNFGISPIECKELILDYRNLQRITRINVSKVLKEALQPKNFPGNKKEKRDFHNWTNQSQQIWHLFNDVVFFFTDNKRLSLVEDNSTDRTKWRRSAKVKEDYFINHQVRKTKGYELDHIIPLLVAETLEDFSYLDDWKNLLYIDGKTHAIKTQSQSKHNKLKTADPSGEIVHLCSADGDVLKIKNNVEGFYNPKLLPKLLNYNSSFLSATKESQKEQ